MEDDKKLSAERSLEIIGDAIWRSRRDVTADAATPMIVWGALICITGIAVSWTWRATGDPLWNLLWVAMGGIGWAYYLINLKRKYDGGQAPTFAAQVIRWTWMFFAAITVFAAIYSCLPDKAAQGWPYAPIYPAVLLLFSLASAVSTAVMGVNENYGFSMGVAGQRSRAGVRHGDGRSVLPNRAWNSDKIQNLEATWRTRNLMNTKALS